MSRASSSLRNSILLSPGASGNVGKGLATACLDAPLSRAMLPLLLCLAIFLGIVFNLHGFPLFDLDEGAFSEATREMLVRGDWITTYLNGEPRFDKPILIYWLQALSVSLLGLHEFALRLPSAVAAGLWMVCLCRFTQEHTDRDTGYLAAIMAVTSVGIGVIGRAAIADALLNLFLALSMFDLYRYLQAPRRATRWRVFLWIGLGLLTKGPVALLIPGAVSLIVFALQGQFQRWREAVFDPVGWGILLLVAGPWYALEYAAQGDAFIQGFLLHHNLQRLQSPLQGHSGGMLYYLPVTLLLLLPYSTLFLRTLAALPGWRSVRSEPLPCLLWTWFAFVLVFFSFSGTKLPHYLIHGVTPLFVLMAQHRERLRSGVLALLPALLLLGVVAALPMLLARFGNTAPNAYLREMLTQPVFSITYHASAAALLLLVAMLMCLTGIAAWKRLVGAGLICALAVGGLLLPAVAQLQQAPIKEAALLARESGLPVATLGINMPSFSVYLDDTTSRWQPGHAGLILSRTDRQEELDKLGDVTVLYRKGGILLLQSAAPGGERKP